MAASEIKKRGFGSMTPERQRELASKGGKAAHASGNAHEWTSEEAKRAGAKGGLAIKKKYGSMWLHEIGRKGGIASRKKPAATVVAE